MIFVVPTLNQTIVAIIVFWVLSFFFKFIVRPYYRLQHYKKQNGVVIFHWSIIPYIDSLRNLSKHGHFYHEYIEAFKKNPGVKFIAENFGTNISLILIDPEAIKDCLMRHETFERDMENLDLFMELFSAGGGSQNTTKWKRSRRITSTVFSFDRMRDMIPIMVEVTQEAFQSWIKENKLSGFHLTENIAGITGEITGRGIFGAKFNQYKIQGVTMSQATQKLFSAVYHEFFSPSPLSVIFGPKFYKTNILERHRKLNRTIAELRVQAQSMLKDIEKNGKREKNLVWALLDDRGTNPDSLNDDEVLDEFVGLFAAGTDTTAHLISSAIFFLWKYPEVFEKVKKEVDAVFVDLKSLDLGEISQMEYMTCFLKETLRLGGPTALLHPRRALKDDNIGGINVTKGTKLNYYNNVFFMSDRYYTDPTEFRPERWMPRGSNQDGYRNEPYAFIPFGAGPRNCVGQHLAQIQAKVIIGMFIKAFDFQFPKDYNLKLIQRGTFKPVDEFVLTLNQK